MKPTADSICYGRRQKRGDFSGLGRAALNGKGRRESAATMQRQYFRCQILRQRQGYCRHRRQSCRQIMGHQTQGAGMRWRILMQGRMLDTVHSRRPLGENQNSNKKEMAQRIHSAYFSRLERASPSDTPLPGNSKQSDDPPRRPDDEQCAPDDPHHAPPRR